MARRRWSRTTPDAARGSPCRRNFSKATLISTRFVIDGITPDSSGTYNEIPGEMTSKEAHHTQTRRECKGWPMNDLARGCAHRDAGGGCPAVTCPPRARALFWMASRVLRAV